MSFFIHPPVSAGSRQPGDELDNLLRAYFQAEMPNPWPALEIGAATGSPGAEEPALLSLLPAESSTEPVARAHFLGGALVRSRLALAASVALLVSGPLFLGGQLQNSPTTAEVRIPGDFGTATKDPDHLRPYKITEGLTQKPDGTYIEINLFEVPPGK